MGEAIGRGHVGAPGTLREVAWRVLVEKEIRGDAAGNVLPAVLDLEVDHLVVVDAGSF